MIALYYVCIALFLTLCFLLCAVVLVQESKSLGLGASFGGDPGDSVFGTSTAQVLKKFTAVLAAIFAISCVLLSIWTNQMGPTASPLPTMLEEEADA